VAEEETRERLVPGQRIGHPSGVPGAIPGPLDGRSMVDRPTCWTCAYWQRNVLESQDEIGECRRHAPMCVAGVTPSDSEAFFPETWPDHWCGEHPRFPEYIRSLKTVEYVQSLKAAPPVEGPQDDKIDFWSWGARERKVVHKMKIETWSQLANLTAEALSAQYGCGAVTLRIIFDKLRARSLDLRTDGQEEPR
jgi:hypothetical protein